MTTRLRIASAQINPVVGDVAGNRDMIAAAYARGRAQGADLVVVPELAIIGYPPEDLILKPAAVADAMAAIEDLARETAGEGPGLIVGTPWVGAERAHNAVVLLDDGIVHAIRFKRELPNYGVFDEKRVFDPGPIPEPIDWRGLRLGLPICEDVWRPEVPIALADAGAEMLICINGSPWRRTIQDERAAALKGWVGSASVPLIFVNQAGGQDELVFDGASFSIDASGAVVQQLADFGAAFDVATWEKEAARWRCVEAQKTQVSTGLEADWRAAVMAIGDYVDKNGFPGVVLGLSGGVDSALTAVLAVDALGADRVWCVLMPSRFTSGESLEDAEELALGLGARFDVIHIEPAVGAFADMLGPLFDDRAPDAAEENIQSRVRGVILMALSNKFGPMVLTTGNKSEMAVGYATLYGDMNGGYNALKDLYKTEVYALARWRNAHRPDGLNGPEGLVLPERIIERAPSAELKAGQTDQDSLPPYDVLDDILRRLVDREESVDEIAERHDRALVERIEAMVYRAEYKRRQAPPGAKIGTRNFGRDRRYPITNKYRDS